MKYFGIAQKLTKYNLQKGNWNNREGVYVGCGKQNGGIYIAINGEETLMDPKVSLEEGDVIGVKYDTHKGKVEFDLNCENLNVSYIDDSLKINIYYPTIDMG